MNEVSREVGRTWFRAPEGFDTNPIEFRTLGLTKSRRMWQPIPTADRILAIAPFVTVGALDVIPAANVNRKTLVSRQLELDNIPLDRLRDWDTYILSDGVEDEPDDFVSKRPSGLHAKLLIHERDNEVIWQVGSANLTTAAFSGKNVEVIARITAPLQKRSSKDPRGIVQFLESGFKQLLQQYSPSKELEDGIAAVSNEDIEATKKAILDADLLVHCIAHGNDWTWRMEGSIELPPNDVRVQVWPVTIDDKSAKTLSTIPIEVSLTTRELTSLVAFRLQDPREDVEDTSFVLNLPAKGMPEDRMHHLLVSLIDDWDRFRAFLRALLGGFEEMGDISDKGSQENTTWQWDPWNADTLLEDLVRNASRHPERLEPIQRLISDIRKTEKGKKIIPDDFLKLWNAVNDSLEQRLKL